MYYYSTENIFRNATHIGMLKRARERQPKQLAGQIKREAGPKIWNKCAVVHKIENVSILQ